MTKTGRAEPKRNPFEPLARSSNHSVRVETGNGEHSQENIIKTLLP